MNRFSTFSKYIIGCVVLQLAFFACRQEETDNRCQCIDNNGAQVIDTIYHMEYDQAYQLCEGKEGTQNIWKCECSKL